MKHTTEELLFAAAVRERIGTLRVSKTKNMTDAERAAFNERPANELVEEALQEFDGIATLIAQIRSREEPGHQ